MRYKSTVRVGEIEVAIGAWCPEEAESRGIKSWSLASIQKQEDIFKQGPLASALCSAFRSMGVHRGYAPNVARFSANIVHPGILEETIDLGKNITLRRNPSIPADGVFIRRGHFFAMSGAGCPIIIASSGTHMVVAHAGRDSLIDPGATVNKPSRKHVSVVNAIVQAFKEHYLVPPNGISMTMHFAIPIEAFEHRLDDVRNQMLMEFINGHWCNAVHKNGGNTFYLDLESLFEQQARKVGVRDVSAMNSLAEFPRLAHTRDGKDKGRRNLIVVKRCS